MADSSERELAQLRAEVAELRKLVEERLSETRQPPESVPTLPPGFKISGNRYRKASALRRELLETLLECGWNKSEVARRLGITRVSVWRRMKQLGLPLEPPVDEQEATEPRRIEAAPPGSAETPDVEAPTPPSPSTFDVSFD